ncbi:glycoside hydrolase family 2 protein [Xylariaceae sp. FL1272]|nr:glycoside hydrolase family 2 protein [Xylariaceae sp. FL1272]
MSLDTTRHPTAQPDWNNLNILHRGTLPPRANFHIYDSVKDALSYDSSKARTSSLSGTWKFLLASNPFEGPEGFEDPAFDTAGWDDTQVPGMWQLNGYGKGPHTGARRGNSTKVTNAAPFHLPDTNVNFPIPVDPPNVPFAHNETGHYVRKFTVPKTLRDSQLRLRFEGVDSAYHVWLNGKELGYHQGSRNPAEFDVSAVVDLAGENTVAVKVYQYCDGAYIEDQDQWRISGIFRDVHLVGFPSKARIEDLFIQTDLDKDYVNAELKLRVDVNCSCEIQVTLYDSERTPVFASGSNIPLAGSTNLSFKVKNPAKWTAETPRLYHLVVALNGTSFLSQRVGFRQVEMKDGLIKVNGQRIVLKGANRHEHHPQFGRAVPYEFMKQDLLLMKTHNINAIRTSHQPSDVRLYDLADELGFWVMDEADLECHGFESICDAELSPSERALPFRERQLLTRANAAKWTSDNPAWEKAYVDRAIQLVRRDQLHPSVIMWSLGNEAFFGRNHVAMTKWIKSYDDSRPVHYEADIHAETVDMYSRMYPPVEEIIEFGKDESKTKPLVLCEFVHAMGNGPGNIKEYVDAFYDYEKLQGGFVWEWANHGLLTKDKGTGEEYYAYGGDFGDDPNDANFVMDGVLFSDHTPNPGLIEYKKAMEPVKVVSSTPQQITIVNRYDFVTLNNLEATYITLDEGKETGQSGSIRIPPGIKPGHTAKIDLPASPSKPEGEGIVRLVFKQKTATGSLPAGHEIAFAEIPLNPNTPTLLSLQPPVPDSKPTIKETGDTLLISTPTTSWKFNRIIGQITSFLKNGVDFLATAPEITFFRAPTDNDEPQDGADWMARRLDIAGASTRETSTTWSQDDQDQNLFTITVKQRFAPPVFSWSIDLSVIYTFSSSGSVHIHVSGSPQGKNLPRTLPRIGLEFELPPSWAGDSAVTWYGRGPGESYSDKKLSQRTGVYTSCISDLWTEYEYPQEGGNRTDTRWVRFNSNQNQSITAQFSQPGTNERALFDFNASHYRTKDIAAAKHPHELRKKKQENVIVRLDAKHHGLGSGSCGPRTRDEYALLTQDFEFEVLLS